MDRVFLALVRRQREALLLAFLILAGCGQSGVRDIKVINADTVTCTVTSQGATTKHIVCAGDINYELSNFPPATTYASIEGRIALTQGGFDDVGFVALNDAGTFNESNGIGSITVTFEADMPLASPCVAATDPSGEVEVIANENFGDGSVGLHGDTIDGSAVTCN